MLTLHIGRLRQRGAHHLRLGEAAGEHPDADGLPAAVPRGVQQEQFSPCLSGIKHISNETFVVPVWQPFSRPLQTYHNGAFLQAE